jgi:hypothetical protein
MSLSQNNSEKDDRKDEEIRGIFVLGLLAVLASIRVQSDKIMVTVGQISIDFMPFLNITLVLWSFYAIFMVFGLSEDILGKTASNMFRQGAKLFLQLNFLILAALSLILGLSAYPTRLPWALGLIGILSLYALVEKLRESKSLKPEKPLKRSLWGWVKSNSVFLSSMLILISFTEILFGADEIYILPSFVVGCIGIVFFIISLRRAEKKSKVSTET